MVTARKPRRRKAMIVMSEEARDALSARCDVAEAQRDALRSSLVAVLATLPNEWAPAEVQAVRRHARAVVEEASVVTTSERSKL